MTFRTEYDLRTGETKTIQLTQEEIDANTLKAQAEADQQRLSKKITPRQLRLALLDLGRLDEVETKILLEPKTVAIEWGFSGTIRRDSTLIARLTTALGLTETQVDNLFTLASTK